MKSWSRTGKTLAFFNEAECQYYQYSDTKLLYREHYYDAYNYVITYIDGWFDEPDFKLHSKMHCLLLEPRNTLLYQENTEITLLLLAKISNLLKSQIICHYSIKLISSKCSFDQVI